MTQYLYPQNLKATANLWLWGLRDFAILGIAALLSIVCMVQFGFFIPAAATLCYGFLTIRMDETTVMDFMEDFYKLCEEEFMTYDKQRRYLYTEQTLQEVCLGIHSMCVGSESVYFNGYSNITDDAFLVFGVKGLMDTNKRLKDAMLFNILSYMSNQLLGVGNTAASIDELYATLPNTVSEKCSSEVRT